MSNLKESLSSYNSKIKEGGKGRYFFRLLLTSILQAIAISGVSSLIDHKYDTLILKTLVIFIFLLAYNLIAGFLFIWPRL